MERNCFKKGFLLSILGCLFSLALFADGIPEREALPAEWYAPSPHLDELLAAAPSMSAAQVRDIIIEGTVVDSLENSPLSGVTVQEVGTTNGTITDDNGHFRLQVKDNAMIEFSSIGFKPVSVNARTLTAGRNGVVELNISLERDASQQLEEAVIVGFGTQKKASVVSSITTINPGDLKGPTSNLTQMFAGRIPGMISFQRSGEPGLDNSQFFIRGLSTFGSGKRDPLILIDGVESSTTDLARLQPDDIADFSVLKDAAAAAVYGARGANGVLLVNTREGKEGKTRFFFRAENRLSSNTKNFRNADNITYMREANVAATTRSPLGFKPYSENKIEHTLAGDDPFLYPNNNWPEQLLKKYTLNQAYNLNLSGGSSQFQYYISGTYNIDNGGLKVEPINDFNNNIKLKNYSLRAKMNLQVTKTTNLMVNVYAQFDDYNGPIGGGAQAFTNIISSNPVAFPAMYPASLLPFAEHPLFGSAQVLTPDGLSQNLYVNPFAELVKGYSVYKNSTVQPQLQIKQDLKFITEGLNFRGMGYLRRYSHYALFRSYSPFYYDALIDPETHSYQLRALNDGGANSIGAVGREFLDYNQDGKDISSTFWLEGALNYNRKFGKNDIGASLISYISDFETGNAGTLIASLPQRNQGVSGRFSYGFDSKYLFEFDFGYNGSERFASSHRYGFFPSWGIGYRVSEENFFKDNIHFIDNFKLRATYGLVGNDQVGNVADRFFYLSNVNLEDGAYGATFGKNTGVPPYSRNGISISRYQNNSIGWEISRSLNLGLDMTIFHNLDITVDVYKQVRTNILQPKSNIESAAGFAATPSANYGKATTKGVDLALDYKKGFNSNLWMTARATLTYATSRVNRIDEIDFPADIKYLSQAGHSISQPWGLIAERLFVDDKEVANSPLQFSDNTLLGGDIKYKDINGDGLVNGDDRVPIGFPTQPELIYGFGTSVGWKSFDFNIFFQGSARSSFFINAAAISPFNINGGYQNGLLQVIADNHWSEDNQDLYAFWPRYSGARIQDNNVRQSTWWLRNGDFLRLKTVELGYTIPSFSVLKQKISKPRVYVSGENLFIWSSFKLWDVEMGGNGLSYPIQSVYNLGLEINF